jgi:predicted adenylyl cyclase CyaB
MKIEVEVRSFISEQKYNELINFFKSLNLPFTEDFQDTYYFDKRGDLRIYKTKNHSLVLFKKGKLHDFAREEIEVKFKREDFENLEKLFTAIGFGVKIKWLRKRIEFKWQEINVCLDNTKGYGHIIELEIMSNEENKDQNLEILKQKLQELNISLTPRGEFDKKYDYYLKNWQTIIKS